MLKFLPAGFVGLMVGGLIAANSSTILTHLNWGASYLVHDFYRRFIRRDAAEKHYVAVGRLATVGLFLAFVGLVYRARHREGRVRHHPAGRRGHRAALSRALVLVARQRVVRSRRDGELVRRVDRRCSCLRKRGGHQHARGADDHGRGDDGLLGDHGVRRSADRPGGAGRVLSQGAAERPGLGADPPRRPARLARVGSDNIPLALLGWVAGCTAIWSALFAVGNYLYHRYPQALALTAVFAVSAALLTYTTQHLWSGDDDPQRG